MDGMQCWVLKYLAEMYGRDVVLGIGVLGRNVDPVLGRVLQYSLDTYDVKASEKTNY